MQTKTDLRFAFGWYWSLYKGSYSHRKHHPRREADSHGGIIILNLNIRYVNRELGTLPRMSRRGELTSTVDSWSSTQWHRGSNSYRCRQWFKFIQASVSMHRQGVVICVVPYLFWSLPWIIFLDESRSVLPNIFFYFPAVHYLCLASVHQILWDPFKVNWRLCQTVFNNNIFINRLVGLEDG